MNRVYFGVLILLAMVLGGGTEKFLGTDFILQLLMLPIVFIALRDIGQLPRSSVLFIAAVTAYILFQMVPGLGWLSPGAVDIDAVPGGFALSRDVGRTADTLIYWVVAVSMFAFVARDPELLGLKLFRYVLIGSAFNIVIALVQFSASREFVLGGLFDYEAEAGFFANRNHFSTLMFVSIPVAICLSRMAGVFWTSFIWVGLVIFAEFVAGSDAGIGLSMLTALASYMVLRLGSIRQGSMMLALSFVIILVMAGIFVAIRGGVIGYEFDVEVNRAVMARTTLEGIVDFLPFGSGFGTFVITYPRYEDVSNIIDKYINHAHNDYLELLLEGGIPAAILLVWYLVLLVRRVPSAIRSPLALAALISVLAVCAHSVVDYPLRTMAILLIFAAMNGIVFGKISNDNNRRMADVNVNGRRQYIPLNT